MNTDAIISAIASRADAGEEMGDYRKDGLRYCGHCDTPKQCRIVVGGKNIVVGCQCACRARKYEADKKARQDQEHRLYVESLRTDGIRDKALAGCRFDGSDMTEELTRCKRYADRFDDMVKSNSGLLLWGNTGNGKTYAAACIANQLIDRGIPAMITSFPRILNSGYDKQEIAEKMRYYPLLVIDDLGAERGSDYALETVYMVIDERYKAKKPLIVTTNLTLDEICKPKNMAYQRIYDRVLEMCVPVSFRGTSCRREKAKDQLSAIRAILEGEG